MIETNQLKKLLEYPLLLVLYLGGGEIQPSNI
jgi:hypothetical protein